MLNKSKELNFEGQNIYVGIDVHLKSWNVTILTEFSFFKTFSQDAEPIVLRNFLEKNFPGAIYHSAYESGFSGLWAHYELCRLSVNNIVVNAADVPSTQKEKLNKRDAVDSKKIAQSLRSGSLTGIYIAKESSLEAKSLVRARCSVVKDMTRIKARIKSLLYYYGIKYPPAYIDSSKHWSKRFVKWLKQEVLTQTDIAKQTLEILLDSFENQRELLLKVTKKVRELSQQEAYRDNMALIRSVPGIGLITGISYLTELENINRFSSTDKFAGYIGLIPNCKASGEKEYVGEITFRGQKYLRKSLVECAWVAIRIDSALTLAYTNYCKRMESNKAIIRIARKLANRIYFVLTKQRKYVHCVVK